VKRLKFGKKIRDRDPDFLFDNFLCLVYREKEQKKKQRQLRLWANSGKPLATWCKLCGTDGLLFDEEEGEVYKRERQAKEEEAQARRKRVKVELKVKEEPAEDKEAPPEQEEAEDEEAPPGQEEEPEEEQEAPLEKEEAKHEDDAPQGDAASEFPKGGSNPPGPPAGPLPATPGLPPLQPHRVTEDKATQTDPPVEATELSIHQQWKTWWHAKELELAVKDANHAAEVERHEKHNAFLDNLLEKQKERFKEKEESLRKELREAQERCEVLSGRRGFYAGKCEAAERADASRQKAAKEKQDRWEEQQRRRYEGPWVSKEDGVSGVQ
jgi:hypothetical protein